MRKPESRFFTHSPLPAPRSPLPAPRSNLSLLQVRPPLRGLLRVLQASNPGNVLLNMQKHLARWVLRHGMQRRGVAWAQAERPNQRCYLTLCPASASPCHLAQRALGAVFP
jgi:hypothetical protein